MRFNRLETLDRLLRGREVHSEVITESREKARLQYIEYLEEALNAAKEPDWKSGDVDCGGIDDEDDEMPTGFGFSAGARMHLSISAKVSHVKCFDHLILMFKVICDEELELGPNDFGMLMHVLEMPEVVKEHEESMKGG